MTMMPVWSTKDLPFLVGLNDEPGNLYGLPDRLPFSLIWDDALGLLRQAEDERVTRFLNAAYAYGSLLGTAMDDSPMGLRYAEDMLGFVTGTAGTITGRRVLEIGAGRGYLLRLLRELGAEVLGIEPGASNRPHWDRHNVPVIVGMFPRDLPPDAGRFDVVIAYGVLEHVADPVAMLRQAWDRLTEGGVLCIAVPDCTAFIAAGDISMLVHEHYSYFTAPALARVLVAAGFADINTRAAGYGGVLLASGVRRSGGGDAPLITEDERAAALAFGTLADTHRAILSARLEGLVDGGRSLGLYCPARALNLLPDGARARLFDDDADLHGRFYPTLTYPVEGRDALIAEPVDELWIMSRSFGPRLAATLANVPAMRATRILTINDLIR